jgi:hypothetical protein
MPPVVCSSSRKIEEESCWVVLRSALPSAAHWLEPLARISRTRILVANITKILPFSSDGALELWCGPFRWLKLRTLILLFMLSINDVSCWGVKVKVKSLCLTKHHTMKTYWRSGGIAPLILDLGIRWRCVVSFTPRSLYPQGKSPWYPLDRRLGGPQSRSGDCDEEKIPSSRRESNPRTPLIQPVVQRNTGWAITALSCWRDRHNNIVEYLENSYSRRHSLGGEGVGKCEKYPHSFTFLNIWTWRRLQNEELQNLYAAPNFIRAIKSRVRWACNTHGRD